MFRFIEQLQRRPERERRVIALALAGGATGVIALLWLMGSTLYGPVPERTAEEQGPISSLGESIGGVVNETLHAVGEIRTIFRGTPETYTAK